jgi:signal transduction histidine kinase
MPPESISLLGWRYLMESAPLLFLRLNGEGEVMEANAFTRDRLLGGREHATLDDVFLPFAGPMDLNALREEPDQIRLMHAAATSGLPETFHVQFLPFGDETLVFGSLDADETGRLRRELITLNNQMSALSRELQKKNRELEALNRLKNQFLGMAAHDLRKPVSAILTYSEFLIDEAGDVLNEEHLGFLKTIRGSTDLMRRVIDDFLDIAMIESGRFDVSPEWSDLMETINRSVALNRLPAHKRGVTLVFIPAKKPVAVFMDSAKIEQVLNNLIANAVEHSAPDSEVNIDVLVAEKDITVKVNDAGPGISPDDRETLFKPFVRGSVKKGPGVKSTGLGLAISKKIVEAHGGTIWVEERPGNGAAFAFSLPQQPFHKE